MNFAGGTHALIAFVVWAPFSIGGYLYHVAGYYNGRYDAGTSVTEEVGQ